MSTDTHRVETCHLTPQVCHHIFFFMAPQMVSKQMFLPFVVPCRRKISGMMKSSNSLCHFIVAVIVYQLYDRRVQRHKPQRISGSLCLHDGTCLSRPTPGISRDHLGKRKNEGFPVLPDSSLEICSLPDPLLGSLGVALGQKESGAFSIYPKPPPKITLPLIPHYQWNPRCGRTDLFNSATSIFRPRLIEKSIWKGPLDIIQYSFLLKVGSSLSKPTHVFGIKLV